MRPLRTTRSKAEPHKPRIAPACPKCRAIRATLEERGHTAICSCGWRGNVGELRHLSKSELEDALLEVSKRLEGVEKNRAIMTRLVAALVYRDALRGLLAPNGDPVMPMRAMLGPDLVRTGERDWSVRTRSIDQGIAVIVEPAIAPEDAKR